MVNSPKFGAFCGVHQCRINVWQRNHLPMKSHHIQQLKTLFRHPNFQNFLKMLKLWSSMALAKSGLCKRRCSSLGMFEHPVGLSVQNPAQRGGEGRWLTCLGINGGQWHVVGSAVSGESGLLAARDKMPLRESGTPHVGTTHSQAECLTPSITVFSMSKKFKLQNTCFCEGFERMGAERTSVPPSPSKKTHPKIQ